MVKEKKAKLKKIKIDKVKTEEQEQIEKFLKILGIILILVLVVYVFTKVFVTKEVDNSTKEITVGKINYDKLIVGSILSQSYNEYYVFVYNGNGNEAIYYSSIIDTYMSKEKALKVYWVDLDNKLNEKFIASDNDVINKSPEEISDLKFGEYTLLKVKNGKIVKFIDNIEGAKKELNK